jgi:hypothetical protein
VADLGSLGKLLVVGGLVLAAVGVLLVVAGRIPFIGRLPGDVLIQRGNTTFYFPIVTSILISIVLSLVLNVLARR